MSIENAIKHAVQGDSTEFRSEIEGILMNKVKDAVELKRIQVATNMFNDQEQTDVEDVQPVDA